MVDGTLITFFVGDVTDHVRIAAQSHDPKAQLITRQNYKNIALGTYYVSLGDFDNLQQFVDALDQAATLIYVPPPEWSDTRNQKSYMQHWTEFYLMFFKDKKTVVLDTANNEVESWLELVARRQHDAHQLWVAGCSTTHGDGVELHQRYGQLIADALNLPVSFLTSPGSSIAWAADQILRSDIRSGDVVVWGLTHVGRFPYCRDSGIKHVNIGTYKSDTTFRQEIGIEHLTNKNNHYRAITAIHQVINFCQKADAKLYFGGILVESNFLPYVVNLPNYTQLFGHYPGDHENKFFDIGSDNEHPGPLTHQYYAKTLLDKIKHE